MRLLRNKAVRQALGVLETANWLSVKLFFKNRAQWRVYPNIVYRQYVALAGKDLWRSASIFELTAGATGERIVIEDLPGEGIATSVAELAHMAKIARAVRPQRVFEIGTFRGRTALNFAINAPEACQVYTLDLPPDDRATSAMNAADSRIVSQSLTGIDYQGKPGSEKITQLFGDSTTFDYSPYYGQMDIVFVDGAHHYDAVVSDTKNALKLVRPGGVILWHDWGNYGDYNDVVRAVRDVIGLDKIAQIESTELAFYRAGNPEPRSAGAPQLAAAS